MFSQSRTDCSQFRATMFRKLEIYGSDETLARGTSRGMICCGIPLDAAAANEGAVVDPPSSSRRLSRRPMTTATERYLPVTSGGDAACAGKSSLLLSLQETLEVAAKSEQELSGLNMSFITANSTSFQFPPPPPDEVIPLHNVGQLVACSLPRDAKASKEAKLLVQHSLAEFIAFVTSEAADICTSEKISVKDIKQALNNLGASAAARQFTARSSLIRFFLRPWCAQACRCFPAWQTVGNCLKALGSLLSASFHL